MSNKPRILTVGKDGTIRFPPDTLEALDIHPGGQVKLFVDTRRQALRVERHSEDPWSDALRQKPQTGFDEIFDAQKEREEQARKLFEKRVKEDPPAKRRPEDDPDYWR